MNHRNVIRLTAASLLALAALGCDGDPDPMHVAPDQLFEVNPMFKGIDPGETLQLTATLGGNPVDVAWVSSDQAIATVTSGGLVTGVSSGFAAITATRAADPNAKLSSNVTVLPLLGTGLTNNVGIVIGSSGARFSSVIYRIFVPTGKTNLTFTLAGGTGDADIYVGYKTPPAINTTSGAVTGASCRSENGGNGETCSIANPASGTWYIRVVVWDAYAGATLKATYTP